MRRKLVESRTEAQRAIDADLVQVGTNASPKASTLVAPDDVVKLLGPPNRFVSRAGLKLDKALDVFGVNVDNLKAIDVGASTGGFTDCLLQRGVRSVAAVDVGYGQMHWRIRSDDRVDVIERTNIRTADATTLGAPFDLVVSDLSFISLRTVKQQLSNLGDETTKWVLLIKPQFEAGKENVGKGGVIRDRSVHIGVLRDVLAAFDEIGLGCIGLIESPIKGATGNIEFVAYFGRCSSTVTTDTIESTLAGDRT